VTKEELIAKCAREANITKAQATRALNSVIDGVTRSLKKGQKVSFVGFGTFEVARRKARTGRNPQTGQSIRIPASRVPKFRPGKALKEAVKK
jgi:DNA-binding protein HU-beta